MSHRAISFLPGPGRRAGDHRVSRLHLTDVESQQMQDSRLHLKLITEETFINPTSVY